VDWVGAPTANFKGNDYAENPLGCSDAGFDEHRFVRSRKRANTIYYPRQRGHRHRLVQTKRL